MSLPNIEIGSRVVIKAQGREIRGVVKVIANRPNKDGSVDKWNYWDLEYDIENPLRGHGSYGRWKQSQDGGNVEVL
jgi:hypothetical protein